MKKYELLMILEPSISEENLNHFVDDLSKLMEKSKALIEKKESLGVKQLATPIKKITQGHYYLMHFESDSETLEQIKQHFRVQERLLRHMIVDFYSVYAKS